MASTHVGIITDVLDFLPAIVKLKIKLGANLGAITSINCLL